MNPAEIIWGQLGRQARFMIGAKDPISSKGGTTLSFRIGKNEKSINWIRVALAPDDTYTLQFGRGLTKPRVVSEVEGVYADQLNDVIERHTGLRTGGIR